MLMKMNWIIGNKWKSSVIELPASLTSSKVLKLKIEVKKGLIREEAAVT